MKRRTASLIALLSAGVCLYAFAISLDEGDRGPPPTFHATLADPALYADGGVHVQVVDAPAGPHELRFVPNGDSPRTLTITASGGATSFEGTLSLVSELHGAGGAEYYTWDYEGPRLVEVGSAGPLEVRVDPHGQTRGSVSVSLYPR